jgi:hypothetical protein
MPKRIARPFPATGIKGTVVVASKPVEVGQRYRILGASGVPVVVGAGGLALALWEVTRVFMRGDIEHACIKNLTGRPETMTLATSVIADKSRFVPEG